MTHPPIVAHYEPAVNDVDRRRSLALAERLLREQPELAPDEQFRPLVAEHLEDGPTLHLDDLSEVRLFVQGYDLTFMQDRARLRAGAGDFVASCAPPIEGYEEYCRDQLGLGACTWLHPRPPKDSLRVAYACWEDRAVRRKLARALRAGELAYLHPHRGTFAAWELAALLHRDSRRPLKVVAPPPGVAKWANNKLAFTGVVRELFGPRFVPRTTEAANFTTLVEQVRKVAQGQQFIGLKLPDSVGGGGNLVLEAAPLRRLSREDLYGTLRDLLRGSSGGLAAANRPSVRRSDAPALGGVPLVVCAWETDVLAAPSAQLWIPPESQKAPIVEGVFDQMLRAGEGIFVGASPSILPAPAAQQVADRCWLLGLLFQRLGYVGRCSFDMLLVGEDLDRSRLEFLECNGRWGGASLPMSLMNRLFGDFARRPYATYECDVDGLNRLRFTDLLQAFAADLYDARTGRGSLILYGPARMPARSGISVLASAADSATARDTAQRMFPQRLSQLVADRQSPA